MARMIRAFLALPLDKNSHNCLADIQHRLMARIPQSDVRWLETANIHVTIKFLGDIQETLIPDFCQAIDHAVDDQAQFMIQAGGVGCHPNIIRPRIIWLGIQHSFELNRLRSNVEAEFLKLRIPKEKRLYSAHLTLGRVREGHSQERVIGVGKSISTSGEQKRLLDIPVNTICLFQSTLRPSGAEYSVLYSCALKPQSP